MKRWIAVLSIALAACATSDTASFNTVANYSAQKLEAKAITLSQYYAELADASEKYLIQSAPVVFNNRMARMLSQSARAWEEGRISGADFERIRAQAEIAAAQQNDAYIAQQQAFISQQLAAQVAARPRTVDCISTMVGGVMRTVCR